MTGSYKLNYSSSSIGEKVQAVLGTIEADMSGNFGRFNSENLRGEKILNKFLEQNFTTVLDIGAGELQHSKVFVDAGKTVDICDYGNSVYYKRKVDDTGIRRQYIGDFNSIDIDQKYDAVWCCHILEHQLNVNSFLEKINGLLKEDGWLGIVVPPRKPNIVGGHVTLWNAGLVLYNLVLAGFDCSNCKILQYDYNIGIIVKKRKITNLPIDLSMDKGDLELLSEYFPFDAKHDFNGDIMKLNWE